MWKREIKCAAGREIIFQEEVLEWKFCNYKVLITSESIYVHYVHRELI